MINYSILHESTKYYEKHGFQRIEAPWTVSPYIDNITKPVDVTPFELKHNDKRLVGSGEQSFLYLYLKEFLPLGQFQTITPCFRYETFTLLNSKYFMKNELIKTDDVSEDALQEVIEIALGFFRSYIPDVRVVDVDGSYDIMWGDYELGSYGIRHCEFMDWIYATGVAEPRLSSLIRIGENGLSQK